MFFLMRSNCYLLGHLHHPHEDHQHRSCTNLRLASLLPKIRAWWILIGSSQEQFLRVGKCGIIPLCSCTTWGTFSLRRALIDIYLSVTSVIYDTQAQRKCSMSDVGFAESGLATHSIFVSVKIDTLYTHTCHTNRLLKCNSSHRLFCLLY